MYISAGEYLNINSRNHLIYCLDLETGSVKWRFDAGVGVILLNIELFEGKVFLKSLEDKVIWLDALTGRQLENFTASNIPETKRNHTFNGNKAVAIAGDGQAEKAARIVCKNAEGITLWTYVVKPLLKVKEPYAVNFSFLIDGKNLILATYDGKVRSFTIN